MTYYEVRFQNKEGLDGGITVKASDVQEAMKLANEDADRLLISRITAVLPWTLIDELTKTKTKPQ